MRTIELYRKHKAGEVSREKFLYEVRRNKDLPWVTNITSYDDAVKILKNKGIISEADANVATDPAVDRVNPYFLKRGVNKILAKEKELTNDSYINALNKAAKQLEANPHVFDEEMFANAKEVEKADAKLETEEDKKTNTVNKDRQMKKVKGHNIDKANTKVSTKENRKGKPKGVQMMKEDILQGLYDFLKKKDLVNEDVHYSHNIGSEVYTPDGPGNVVEIVGGTLTVEMEDGSHKDFQINTIDHFTKKAQEEPEQTTQDEPSVADMWANWKGKPFGGMVVDPNYQSDLDKKYGKLREYIAKNKHDKEKMSKLKEAIKKLKEAKALVVPKTATGQQIDKLAQADPTIKPGQQIDIIRK
jgi:hypothetical protein